MSSAQRKCVMPRETALYDEMKKKRPQAVGCSNGQMRNGAVPLQLGPRFPELFIPSSEFVASHIGCEFRPSVVPRLNRLAPSQVILRRTRFNGRETQ